MRSSAWTNLDGSPDDPAIWSSGGEHTWTMLDPETFEPLEDQNAKQAPLRVYFEIVELD